MRPPAILDSAGGPQRRPHVRSSPAKANAPHRGGSAVARRAAGRHGRPRPARRRGQPHHRLEQRCLLPEPGRGGRAAPTWCSARRTLAVAVPAARQRLARASPPGRRAGSPRSSTAATPCRNRLSPGQVQIPGLAAMTSAVELHRHARPVQRRAERVRRRHDHASLGARRQGRADRRRHRRQPRHQADRDAQPVERPLPGRGRVRRDRQRWPRRGPTTHRPAPPGRRSARWPRSPPAARTSPRRW